jgi:hypothetical protein
VDPLIIFWRRYAAFGEQARPLKDGAKGRLIEGLEVLDPLPLIQVDQGGDQVVFVDVQEFVVV